MPRPKKPGAPEPKKRSRNGCWNCKARKVKCGEERPSCVNCQRTSEECDYSIRLNWDGRKKKNPGYETILFHDDPSESSSSSHVNARRTSGNRSISSTATASQATDDYHSPSATSPLTGGGAISIPRSEPQINNTSTQVSSKNSFPGAPVFTHFVRPSIDDGEAPPLCSPDLASPMFSLPRPLNGNVSHSASSYVAFSEPSHHARGAHPPPSKRLRYSVDFDGTRQDSQVLSPGSLTDSASLGPTPRLLSSALAPVGSMDPPLTPGASSPYSEDGLPRAPLLKQGAVSSPDVRRMSVNSLLSGPPGPAGPVQYAPPSQRALNARTNLCLSEVTTYYGIDSGLPDLDLGHNDDANAIQRIPEEPEGPSPKDNISVGESAEGKDTGGTGPGGYYERPVPVRIPRDLEPLPAKLRDNPMNLLYFHHFMNHTAKALVPHDDHKSNPYRHVLPQMAVKNDNLLSLMLAYSASHRARLLGHPEPATRIAHWVQDIFPALRRALNDPTQSISNANIATGIMLASLEIVSPTVFGYQIPWQRHLGLARDLIADRPDGIRWTRSWTEEDQVRAFLWSWLAYLDVMGTLSGGRHDGSVAWILEYQKDEYEEEWDEVDCIMGMTTQAVYVLAKIAELAKECDALRAKDPPAEGKAWKPPKDIVPRAWAVENEAMTSMARPPQPCKHLHASGNVARWEQRDITALNEAYHWAGLVHLHRRVLAKPSTHEDVQASVLKIHACLSMVPLGSNAEASILFPLFTAACETMEEENRAMVRQRLRSLNRIGFLVADRATTGFMTSDQARMYAMGDGLRLAERARKMK